MAAAGSFPSRSHSAGTSVSAALGRYSATCTPHFWPPFLIQQILSPRVRSHVVPWEGAGVGGEARLVAAHERVKERAIEGHPPCRSASARKSGRSHTSAAFSLQQRESGNVEAPLRTPRASAGGVVRRGKMYYSERRQLDARTYDQAIRISYTSTFLPICRR
jgi:hypothetical protein